MVGPVLVLMGSGACFELSDNAVPIASDAAPSSAKHGAFTGHMCACQCCAVFLNACLPVYIVLTAKPSTCQALSMQKYALSCLTIAQLVTFVAVSACLHWQNGAVAPH